MYSTIQTANLNGIGTIPVAVEVDISTGMPVFDMVGYLSAEVREAKERVKTALSNCGISLPAKRITINLSPGNVKKSGTGFDLPMAVALIQSLGIVEEEATREILMIGELGLNGQIHPVTGILPVVSDGKNRGISRFFVPSENMQEAKLVHNVEVFGFEHFHDVIEFLQQGKYRPPTLDGLLQSETQTVDFAEVNGQQYIKRACEVAAAGMHNLLMIGPPGAGKTMISERVATILPPMTEEEQLEVSKIYSVCGMLGAKSGLICERPFRAPHHTITQPALAGGGNIPRPGEISLAHQGVLFLDELPEFRKSTLEVLRQPMEERWVHIARLNGTVTYPSDFLLLASMNPCNCGYYPNMQKCRCTPGSIRRYLSQVSQPLVDRMDICVEAPQISYTDLTLQTENESSEQIRERVVECQKIQLTRYSKETFHHNSRIPTAKIKQYCGLGMEETKYMEHIYEKQALTARTYHKILRVARTIADLDHCEQIGLRHLNEAVCYRSVDDKFWGGLLL